MHKLAASYHHHQLAHSACLYHTVRAMLGNQNRVYRVQSPACGPLHATTAPQRQAFADNLVVYCDSKSETDVATLQEDMNRLVDWETTWGMKFHPDKTRAIS